MSIFEEHIDLIREDGVAIPGYRVTPDSDEAVSCKGAGVIVLGGEWALGPEEHQRLVMPLASFGYFVVALDLVRGRRAASAEDARQRAAGLDHGIAIDDLVAGILSLKELASGRIGVIGIGLGAAIAVEAAATLPHIDAVVHLDGPPPAAGARLSRLRATVLLQRAGKSTRLTAEAADAVVARAKRSRAQFVIYDDYGVGDDFFLHPKDDEEKTQAEIAWDRTRDFLAETLT